MKLDFVAFLAGTGIIQGIFLWGILFKMYRPGKISRRLLLTMTGIHTYVLFMYFIMHSDLYKLMPHLIATHMPLVMLIAPALWFYLRFITHQQTRFVRADLLHLLPALIHLLILIPLYASGATYKITGQFGQDYFIRLELVEIIKLIIPVTYGSLSYKLIQRRLSQNKDKQQQKKLKTFSLFMILYLLNGMSSVVYHLAYHFGFQTYWVHTLLNAVSVILLTTVLFGLAYAAITNPGFLGKNVAPLQVTEAALPKYHSSSLNHQNNYQEALLEYMEQEKPYTDNELKLEDLAQVLGIPVPHLSEVLNQHIGKSFSELINGYRVEEVKIKMTDPAESHKTLLALAFEAGFNSKTAFNRFFKQYTGKTPSQYRKEV